MKYLIKIFVGFLYGLGFSGALTLVLWVSNNYETENIKNETQSSDTSSEWEIKAQAAQKWKADFDVKDKGMVLSNLGPEFLVVVSNNSLKSAIWVFMRTDFFDDKGEFIYQCEESYEAIPAGEAANIKIRCNMSGNPTARSIVDSLDSYKTYVHEVH